MCCKHIHAVEFSLKIREAVEKKTIIEPVDVNICLHCKGSDLMRRGVRRNKAGNLQIWQCRSCERYFTVNLGFEKMRASPETITSVMQLYCTGESYRGIQKFLKLRGVEMSHVAIYRWVDKYTKLMDKYLETITPQVGDKWHADEV